MNPVAMLAHSPLLLIRSSLSKIKLDEGDPLMIGDLGETELTREPIL